MIRENKIKVTVITGFLGSGKTTFINNLLQKNASTQFALVENEFGDISIDTQLIKGVDASQMFELKKGCICCTISDEYELVLKELAERFPNVGHLLIETTGIADPASVIGPFYSDEQLKNKFEFFGTICLVDALNFKNHPEKEIATKQITTADLILINKSQHLTDLQKSEFQTEIRITNPFAEISFVDYANASQIQLNKIAISNFTNFKIDSPQKNHQYINSQSLTFQQPLNKKDFIRWLSYTTDVHKNKIYRFKGIMCFYGELYEYYVQGVGSKFEIIEGENLLNSTTSILVFIGNQLPNLSY